MPSRQLRHLSWIMALLSASLAAQAQDLHIKKNILSGGYIVSSTDTSIKGARERSVSQSATGNTVTLRQCDLKRTVTLNEQAQTYYIENDPKDEAVLKAAALAAHAATPDSGAYITETSSVTDTGERKTMYGYPVRHLKTTVSVQSSPKACTQVSQKYELDGWYADLSKEMSAACRQTLAHVRETDGCNDPVVQRRSGSAKAGYPLVETLRLHNPDGTATEITVQTSDLSKQTLEKELFDIPPGYREVKSLDELNATASQPQAAQQPVQQAYSSPQMQQPAPQQQAPTNAFNQGAAAQQFAQANNPVAKQMIGQKMAWAQAAALGLTPGGSGTPNMGGMMGQGATPGGAPVATPQALGPKAPGKIRIGVVPSQAQLGQGSNTQEDFSTPIRNSIILLMSGPAVEVAALDSRLPLQVQAEAQQKQCDYILYSAVTVKHGGGGFGKFMKMAGPMASMAPMAGAMGHGMGGAIAAQTASMAASQAAQAAQQQAMNQLAGFNGQIKSKDDVTIGYQLFPTGQDRPRMENTLKAKAKSDGEDVLTPLIEQAANSVLTEVSKK